MTADGPYRYLAEVKLKYLQDPEHAANKWLDEKIEADGPMVSELLKPSSNTTGRSQKDPKTLAFFNQVRKKIAAIWRYPCVKTASDEDCQYKNAEVIIEAILLNDGTAIYDFNALEAIVLASPFPEVAGELKPDRRTLHLRLHSHYVDNRTESSQQKEFLPIE